MRVLIDTNILVSAALSPNGTPYKAFLKAVTYPNKGVICDQNIEEIRRIFNRKFPQKIPLLEHFLSIALLAMEVVVTPNEELEEESYIRDVADRPILTAERKKIHEENIKIIIDTLKELNASCDFVSAKLMEKYSLTPEQAEEKSCKYW